MWTFAYAVCLVVGLAPAPNSTQSLSPAEPKSRVMSEADVQCPEDWSLYSGRCYKAVSELASPGGVVNQLGWSEARNICLQLGADLAVINTEQENTDIGLVVQSTNLVGTWLRCTSTEKGHYVCDGDVAFYNGTSHSGYWNWATTEFSDSGAQQCLHLSLLSARSFGVDVSPVLTERACTMPTTRPGVVCERSPVEESQTASSSSPSEPVHTTTTASYAKERKVCYVFSEPDPESDHQQRWFLALRDPCSCTNVRMGGVNVRPVARPFEAKSVDSFVLTNSRDEIKRWLRCENVSPRNEEDRYVEQREYTPSTESTFSGQGKAVPL